MKKLIMALMVSATTSSAFAVGADMTTVYNCKQAVSSKSMEIKVRFSSGGIIPITHIWVYKISKEKVTLDKYIGKLDKPIPGLAGGASVYRDKDMSFSINQTSNPMLARKATLVENGATTKLLCEREKAKPKAN